MDLVYPLQVANGKLVTTTSYETIVRQHIIHALDTRIEELLMFPEYGTPVAAFASIGNLPRLLSDIKDAVSLSLLLFEDVFIDIQGGFTDDGRVDLAIEYSIEDVAQLSIERLIDLGYG